MQTSVPELMDIARRARGACTRRTAPSPASVSFANNCLLARRLVERGVRFVQLYHRGWDHHGTSKGDDIVNRLPKLCREVDQATAALVTRPRSSAACSTTRSSSGAASSAARR